MSTFRLFLSQLRPLLILVILAQPTVAATREPHSELTVNLRSWKNGEGALWVLGGRFRFKRLTLMVQQISRFSIGSNSSYLIAPGFHHNITDSSWFVPFVKASIGYWTESGMGLFLIPGMGIKFLVGNFGLRFDVDFFSSPTNSFRIPEVFYLYGVSYHF